MTFWWLNMETGCKCLSLSSCWPQLVSWLLSCRKEIQCTLFTAFCHSIHSISYFGLWQVSPLALPSLFTNCRRAPRPPHSLWRWRLTDKRLLHQLLNQLFGLEKEPLTSGGSWHFWQRSCGGESAGLQDSRVRWGLQTVSAGAECVSVLCVHGTLPRQWQRWWFALR